MKEVENDRKGDGTTISSLKRSKPSEVLVLAGGLGTRLKETVPHLPKVMVPVAGRPFLSHLIDALRMQGVSSFVFALGYKADVIEQYLKQRYSTLDYTSVTEEELLGTGGAIRLAIQKVKSDDVFIVNGDTLFNVDLDHLYELHTTTDAECTIALKKIKSPGRYGTVRINEENRILSFEEKGVDDEQLINGGIYLLNKTKFFHRSFPLRFSFEKDYLRTYCHEGVFFGSMQESYFIDIGIPSDYQKAQKELAPSSLDLRSINKAWTLFIDRDGVINDEKLGEYVLQWEHFIFSRGVLHSFKKISDVFGRLLVVTNQKGVGKGLMKVEALDTIHQEMQREVESAGGRIDKIYFCTDIENTSLYRKPNPGMAMLAKKDFPDIDFARSIMVGNKPSDMQFGRAAGMFTVFLATTNPEEPFPHADIDLRFNSLADFAAALNGP